MEPWVGRLLQRTVIALGVLFLASLLWPFGVFDPVFLQLQVIVYALIGWVFYLPRQAASLRVEPAGLVAGVAAVVGLAALTHALGRRWFGQPSAAVAKEGRPRGWTARSTARGVGLWLLAVVAGLSLVGVTHEIAWLLNSPQPVVDYYQSGPSVGVRDNLKQLGAALHQYHDRHQRFPAGGTFDERQRQRHSWLTALLPFVDQAALYDQIHHDLPWRDPANREPLSTPVDVFLHPGLVHGKPDERHDAEGYARSHLAANLRVLGPNTALRTSDIRDGAANTILAGEVHAGFQPWGHPLNARDPALGINRHPQGFGAISEGGGCFLLLADGSVRFVSENIAPQVLKALATPAGGEQVPEF